MSERSASDREGVGASPTSGSHSASPSYAALQLARALATASSHEDKSTRDRAQQKAEKWLAVFEQMLAGDLQVGSRTPVADTPAWATLEVVTGGFATGQLLAEGPLAEDELALAAARKLDTRGGSRLALNRYFLTESGLVELSQWLQEGTYEVEVPEHAALLVVAWLVGNGHAASARALLDAMGGFFPRLRFYPKFVERPRKYGSFVTVQNVGEAAASLRAIRSHAGITAQQEAIQVWTPLYDEIVSLFLESVEGEAPTLKLDAHGKVAKDSNGRFAVEGGWPCKVWRDGWQERAAELVGRFEELEKQHKLTSRASHRKSSLARMMPLLRLCASDLSAIADRDVARIRFLLAGYVTKRGVPGSKTQQIVRKAQEVQAQTLQFNKVARAIVPRLKSYDANQGIENLEPVLAALDEKEATNCGAKAGQALPGAISRRLKRSLHAPIEVLVQRGLIPSGDELAKVLPQITSGLRAAGIADSCLRELYAANYRAFRRRRSLLLLDLQSQVQLEELPWVGAMESQRSESVSSRLLAKQTLQEVVSLALISFPQAILPNKLLQEIRALAKTAALDIPIVDELAADIFMGEFSSKFLHAAKLAGDMLTGTLYAQYYAIDYDAIGNMKSVGAQKDWLGRRKQKTPTFAKLCYSRAGVSAAGWDAAANGMVIEQQQIVTTQNLAPVVGALELVDSLQPHLPQMAQRCFELICKSLQIKKSHWHAMLITVKNSAYAWRQMIFYLSLLQQDELNEFLSWARKHWAEQSNPFRDRFEPALLGLEAAASGAPIESSETAQQFLGWKKGKHWLLHD